MATATDAATETNTIIMQNYCKTIGALAAASALVAGTAKAELEYSINGGFHKEYIFRGVDFGQSMTTAGFDVEGYSTLGFDLSAGIWHADFTAGGANVAETDVYLEATRDLGFATLAIGYIKYIYDDNGGAGFLDDAQEVYFGLNKELYGIDTGLTYYWDIETDNGGYAELTLSKSYDLTDCLSLGIGVAQGYGVEEGELANLTTTATLDWAFTDSATLSPYVLYSVEGSENVHYNNENTQEFVAGVNLSVSF